MTTIQNFAPELFDEIASQLSLRDQKSLRLVNKRVSSLTTPLLFSRVQIPNLRDPEWKVKSLEDLADSNNIGGSVAPWARTVKFDAQYRCDEWELKVLNLLPQALARFTGAQVFKLWVHPDNPLWIYDCLFSALGGLPYIHEVCFQLGCPHLPHSQHGLLPFHHLERLEGLRSVKLSTGDLKNREFAEKAILHPLRNFLTRSRISELSVVLGIHTSDVSLPSVQELLPTTISHVKNLELSGFVMNMPTDTPFLHSLTSLGIKDFSEGGNLWNNLRANRIQLEKVAVVCSGLHNDEEMMVYLSSSSGLREFHLSFQHYQRFPRPDHHRIRTVDLFYKHVLSQHRATLHTLNLIWPTSPLWCFRSVYGEALRACRNLEVLGLIVEQEDILNSESTTLNELFTIAAGMPKLKLLCLNDLNYGQRDFRNLERTIRVTRIQAPLHRRAFPLYLQLKMPTEWVFQLRELSGDIWTFRLVPLAPHTIGVEKFGVPGLA
ncbi:hypothetical protein VNI00_008085 [Paramarasmius palmivorus]|uniref:F-box domain-containing protein n=1 Tax=Paramarasmius palmivorus TaxID=297713 RepID=A0AAW0CYM1_9AGAR